MINALPTVAVLLALAVTLPAAAQTSVADATEEQKNVARASYTAGKVAFEAGDHTTALLEFRKSYASVTSPNTKLMIAKTLLAMNRPAEAYEAYGEAAAEADATEDPKYATAMKTASDEQALLEPMIGFVKVKIHGSAAGGSLNVGGREIPETSWTRDIAVDTGKVDVVLSTADGRNDAFVHVAAGETKSIDISAPEPALVDVAVGLDDSDDDGETVNPLEERANLGLTLAGKVGAGIGKPVSEFGVTPVFEVELGFLLPLPDPVNHSLGLFFAGQYVQPKTDGEGGDPDPRLPGDGVLNYEITQQMLMLTFGASYTIPVGSELIMPYGAVGGRAYFLNTKVTGDAGGEAFGENEELQADFGLYLAGGIDIFVGPGALLAEVQFGYAAVDGFVLRETNVGGLNLAVGYRFVL